MEKQKKVLDASVLVKWFSEEKDTDKALSLHEQHIKQAIKILIPEIAFLEVTNSLRYKNKDEKELQKVVNALWNTQLEVISLTEDLLQKAIRIALENDFTIYDALYIALAQIYGCPLITADKELYKVPNVIRLESI